MNAAKLFSSLLNVNEKVATFIAGGLLFLAAAVMFISWEVDLMLAVRSAAIILGLSIVALIVANFTGTIARIWAWLFFALFTIYAVVLFTQFLCTSCMTPPVPHVGCLVSPGERGCLESRSGQTQIAAATSMNQVPSTRSLQTTTSEETPLDAAKDGNKVFVHFAGSVDRDRIIEVAKKLEAEGWSVEGADHGGERIASAYGLNEIRLFNSDDTALAQKLALDLDGIWQEPDGVDVKSLAGTQFTAPPKHLEIWISK